MKYFELKFFMGGEAISFGLDVADRSFELGITERLIFEDLAQAVRTELERRAQAEAPR